ncbi:MAG TPA: PfkB family carbohydrate kinase, partial [Bacillota bacterium]|nr:PfkB family carbohydrate kinase [Bacillota bacterium]
MKVVGFGDNVVDRYVNKQIFFPGGNCVNFSVYAGKVGVPSAYLGMFGDDREARVIQSALAELGVDLSMCRTEADTVTERCDVNLVDGDRVFAGDDERENIHGPLVLTEKDLAYLSEFDLIHSGCYAGEEEELKKLAPLGRLVSFDFSAEDEYRSDEYLGNVCPYVDFALFSCEKMTRKEIEALHEKVHGLGTQYVMATMGVKGQILYDGKNFYDGHVETLEPVDTMGAGDSFFTAFLMTLLKEGWSKGTQLNQASIEKAFRFAAGFSAETCLVSGAFGFSESYGDADIILRSSCIFTAEKDGTTDGIIAIRGNKILAVGRPEDMYAFLTGETKVYDLGDKTVTPGFVDNHVFFTGYVW